MSDIATRARSLRVTSSVLEVVAIICSVGGVFAGIAIASHVRITDAGKTHPQLAAGVTVILAAILLGAIGWCVGRAIGVLRDRRPGAPSRRHHRADTEQAAGIPPAVTSATASPDDSHCRPTLDRPALHLELPTSGHLGNETSPVLRTGMVERAAAVQLRAERQLHVASERIRQHRSRQRQCR